MFGWHLPYRDGPCLQSGFDSRIKEPSTYPPGLVGGSGCRIRFAEYLKTSLVEKYVSVSIARIKIWMNIFLVSTYRPGKGSESGGDPCKICLEDKK